MYHLKIMRIFQFIIYSNQNLYIKFFNKIYIQEWGQANELSHLT